MDEQTIDLTRMVLDQREDTTPEGNDLVCALLKGLLPKKAEEDRIEGKNGFFAIKTPDLGYVIKHESDPNAPYPVMYCSTDELQSIHNQLQGVSCAFNIGDNIGYKEGKYEAKFQIRKSLGIYDDDEENYRL